MSPDQGLGAATGAAPPRPLISPTSLLLAHHGSPGGHQAVSLALALAVPKITRIVHLLVVPDFWDGMQGDDWLNNSSTRDTFARHVETMLDQDSKAIIEELRTACEGRGLDYETVLRYGDPADCLLEALAARPVDLVVIGPPRPKGQQGLRSRMNLDKLARGLTVPLLVACGV